MINDEMKQLLQITKDEESSLEFSITFPASFRDIFQKKASCREWFRSCSFRLLWKKNRTSG